MERDNSNSLVDPHFKTPNDEQTFKIKQISEQFRDN